MDKDLATALGRLDRYLDRVKKAIRKGDLVVALADIAELGEIARRLSVRLEHLVRASYAGKGDVLRGREASETRKNFRVASETLCIEIARFMAIRIDELEPDKVGSWVTYIRDSWGPRKGRIKTWNQRFVFVVYYCADQWDRFLDFTAAPTNPEDLDFV